MQTKFKDNLLWIRLFPKEDILSSLRKACSEHQVKTAVVISGIGQLKNFELGYFFKKGNYLPKKFKKAFELLSLVGNVSNQDGEYKFHLHAVLGGENKEVIGGHLISGKIEVTGEIILLKTSLKIKRKVEPETGLEGLFLNGDNL